MSIESNLADLQKRFQELSESTELGVEHFIAHAMAVAGKLVFDNRTNLLSQRGNAPAWIDQLPTIENYYYGEAAPVIGTSWDTYWWRFVELVREFRTSTLITMPITRFDGLESNHDFHEVFWLNAGGRDDDRKLELWHQVARASGDVCRFLIRPPLPNQHVANVESAQPKLGITDNRKEILQALLELGAKCKTTRKNSDEVAGKARGVTSGSLVKRELGELKRSGLVESKGGRGGGYWLSATGIDLAKDSCPTGRNGDNGYTVLRD